MGNIKIDLLPFLPTGPIITEVYLSYDPETLIKGRDINNFQINIAKLARSSFIISLRKNLYLYEESFRNDVITDLSQTLEISLGVAKSYYYTICNRLTNSHANKLFEYISRPITVPSKLAEN